MVIVLHQAGHAIAASLFSKQKIVIFLGSYGNKDASANLVVGSWEIWFTANPFLWQCGLCVPSFPITLVNYRRSYLLAGPVLPVAVAAVLADASIFFHFGDYTSFVMITFLVVALLDLIVNLIPWSNPIATYDNVPVFTDGYQLRLVNLQRKYPLEFFTAISQFSKHQYEDAARNFERALRRMPGNKVINENLQECYKKLNSTLNTNYTIPNIQ